MMHSRFIHWNYLFIRAILVNVFALILALSGAFEKQFRIGSVIAKTNRSTTVHLASYDQSIDRIFCDPFGYVGRSKYRSRLVRDIYGNIIENTDYDVNNPDLADPTSCFGVPWNQLWHAGEDLYDSTGASTQDVWVKADADGFVLYAPLDIWYPGLVVIIEHSLPSGNPSNYVYSVYSHLQVESLQVYYGQRVTRGQLIGQVLYQEDVPGIDDSHLHFEIRTFLDGRNIYPPTTTCNYPDNVPGVGYTYPQHPDDFPNSTQYYIHPSVFISNHQYRATLPHVAK